MFGASKWKKNICVKVIKVKSTIKNFHYISWFSFCSSLLTQTHTCRFWWIDHLEHHSGSVLWRWRRRRRRFIYGAPFQWKPKWSQPNPYSPLAFAPWFCFGVRFTSGLFSVPSESADIMNRPNRAGTLQLNARASLIAGIILQKWKKRRQTQFIFFSPSIRCEQNNSSSLNRHSVQEHRFYAHYLRTRAQMFATMIVLYFIKFMASLFDQPSLKLAKTMTKR